jgi:hypothetical protein
MSETSVLNANYLEPTFKRAAIVWWSLLWRGVLLGCGAGFLVGFVEGFIGVLVGISVAAVRPVALVSGLLLGVPIGIYVVQYVLRKRFGEFTIRLVPTNAQPSN